MYETWNKTLMSSAQELTLRSIMTCYNCAELEEYSRKYISVFVFRECDGICVVKGPGCVSVVEVRQHH